MKTLSDGYRQMQQDKQTQAEQIILDAVNALEKCRVDHDMSMEELYEMSDAAVRKLIYNKPLPPNIRKIFSQILKKLAEIMG